MTIRRVPAIATNQSDQNRRVADELLRLARLADTATGAVLTDGADLYIAPTISDPPTAAEVQAIADALAAVSLRLKE